MKKVNKKTENSKNIILSNLKEFYIFYKKEIKKTHIICFIISVIIFGISITSLLSSNENLGVINVLDNVSRLSMVGEKILIIALIIVSGLAPFFFIPVIGVLMLPFNIAVSIINTNIIATVFLSFFVIIQLYFTSLAVAAGIYYCRCSTKKYRYDHSSNYGIDDLKQQLLEISKNKKRLENFKNKRLEKEEKRSKLNIKIKYKMLLITFILVAIPVALISLITGV